MRSGTIKDVKVRNALRIKCESSELIIIGAGKKMEELFESYAIAGLPVPIEISKIISVERIELTDDNFYNVLEVILKNNA